MKFGKIFARTIAIASCVAMLSTNVLAAGLSISAVKDNDKLKVTITGGDAITADYPQVTFLAVDASVDLTELEGDNIQYIYQDDAAANVVVPSFARRAGGENKVTLYAGGTGVESYAGPVTYYIADVVDLAGTTAFDYACEEEDELAAASNADLQDFFAEKGLQVEVAEIGDEEAETVTCAEANKTNFTFTVGAGNEGVYPVTVAYNGVAAEDKVLLTADLPVVIPVESVAITGDDVDGTEDIYVDSASAFDLDAAMAIVEGYDLTITATLEGGDTKPLDLDDLTPAMTDANPYTVTFTYSDSNVSNVPVTGSFTINVIERERTGVTVTGDKAMEMTTTNLAGVTAEEVEAFVKANLTDADFKAEYTWNEPGAPNSSILASALTFAPAVDPADNTKYYVTVTEAYGLLTADNVITVTIEEVASATITGRVRTSASAARKGQTQTYELPAAGASVKLFNASTGAYVKAVVADINGDFSVEVEPNTTYQVVVSYATVTYFGGTFYAAPNYMMAMQEAQVGTSNYAMGDINIRPRSNGDVNADGLVNSTDLNTVKGNFNNKNN